LFSKLRNLGTKNLTSAEEVTKVELLNLAFLLIAIANFLDFIFNVVAGYTNLTLFPLGISLFMIIMLFFNYQEKTSITTITVIIFFDFYLILQHYLFGMLLHITPVYILLTIFIITMFDDQRVKMYTLCTLTLLSYAASRIITDYMVSPYADLVIPTIKDVYFIMTLVLSAILVVRILDQRRNYIKLTKNLLKDVERKNMELENQNKELERFAYATSHDLKTPLRNITSFIELIQKMKNNQQDPTFNKYLEFTKRGVLQMNNSIDDILTFSGLDFNKDSHAYIDLNVLLQNLLFNYVHKIESGNLEINISELPPLIGNKNQINVIFQNLIDNGLKYNDNKLIKIRIFAEVLDGIIQINVQDNGIGIDHKYVNEIFIPFKRLHGNAVYEGTGLGLAIVQKIMESHQGHVEVSSTPEGSIFKLVFPNKLN